MKLAKNVQYDGHSFKLIIDDEEALMERLMKKQKEIIDVLQEQSNREEDNKMKNYKHKFKVGDRVAVYGGVAYTSYHGHDRKLATVRGIRSGGEVLEVTFDSDNLAGDLAWEVHHKQCRKLKPKKEPRRFWVNYYECLGTSYLYHSKAAADEVADGATNRELIEVVEVL